MGYLPGTIWILAGVVFAGAVQDMTVLFLSTRRDGRSLGDIIRSEMGPIAGGIALVGVLLIMIILLAVLALVVVKALVGSPWGTFTVFCTIPIALLMGIYARFIRVGRIAEMSAIGIVLLLVALIYGRTVAENPQISAFFDLSGGTLALTIIGYGFVASVLPVWLLLAPRDYLSTFLKIGTMIMLAVGIIFVHPDLRCLRSRVSSTALVPCGPEACSRSCLSPLRAGRCPASIRSSHRARRQRCWRTRVRSALSAMAPCSLSPSSP
jgi:carbon starvation protein